MNTFYGIVGTRVKCLKEYDGNKAVIGKLGTIVRADASVTGIQFDENVNGHSCGGRCTHGYGWEFYTSNVHDFVEIVKQNEFEVDLI